MPRGGKPKPAQLPSRDIAESITRRPDTFEINAFDRLVHPASPTTPLTLPEPTTKEVVELVDAKEFSSWLYNSYPPRPPQPPHAQEQARGGGPSTAAIAVVRPECFTKVDEIDRRRAYYAWLTRPSPPGAAPSEEAQKQVPAKQEWQHVNTDQPFLLLTDAHIVETSTRTRLPFDILGDPNQFAPYAEDHSPAEPSGGTFALPSTEATPRLINGLMAHVSYDGTAGEKVAGAISSDEESRVAFAQHYATGHVHSRPPWFSCSRLEDNTEHPYYTPWLSAPSRKRARGETRKDDMTLKTSKASLKEELEKARLAIDKRRREMKEKTS